MNKSLMTDVLIHLIESENPSDEDIYSMMKMLVDSCWDNNVPESKFKIGEKVYHKDDDEEYIIGGINRSDFIGHLNSIEYFLINRPYLVYEEELEKVDENKRS